MRWQLLRGREGAYNAPPDSLARFGDAEREIMEKERGGEKR